MKRFNIKTFGCKVNQYESHGIASGLEKKGWVKNHKNRGPDIFIVNTCAVTSKASMQSRQAIRKITREHPDAKVIVTGCHAQTHPDEIRKIDLSNQIVCHKDKTKIPDTIEQLCRDRSSPDFKKTDFSPQNSFMGFDTAVTGPMTRAYLKIQDGCNSFCTYCIVPYARGSSVSMPQKKIFKHLKELNNSGYKEIIITGIHTGAYGLDFKKKSSLLHLLEKINREKPVHRIRLSSIEPGELNEGIINLALEENILCDHFHIPLQSGDNDILKKMKRPYDSEMFENIIQKIHKKIPHAGIGVDTLIGFPGESDRQFQNTYNLIEKLPISYLHVFPFSARKGTPASGYSNKTDPEIIKQRCEKMRELDRTKKNAFAKTNINRKLEGLVLNQADRKTGMLKAVTSNYITLFLKKQPNMKGEIFDLKYEKFDNKMLINGKIMEVE